MKKTFLLVLFSLTILGACSSPYDEIKTTDEYKNVEFNIMEPSGEVTYFGANTNSKSISDLMIQFNTENKLTPKEGFLLENDGSKIKSFKGVGNESKNEWFVVATCEDDLFAENELCLVEDLSKHELKEGDFATIVFGEPQEKIKFEETEVEEEIIVDPEG